MNKKIFILPVFATLAAIPMTLATANPIMAKADVANGTHANGAAYYSAATLGSVTKAWNTSIIPFFTEKSIQFLWTSNNAWGDYEVTMGTMKIDVSQEYGQHKIYTLEGSQSGFRLFDEKGSKIAEKYGDSQGSLVANDDNSSATLYWNRTDLNIEVRIPYVTLVGSNYDISTKGYPTFGLAYQSYYKNGHLMDWAGNVDYSEEWNTLSDPSTYTRVKFDSSLEVNKSGYAKKWEAPYNLYSTSTDVQIGTTHTTLNYNQAYELAYDEPAAGQVFKGFNTLSDGKGIMFPATGTYDGKFPAEIELFPIYDVATCEVKFMNGTEEFSKSTFQYNDSLVLPENNPSKDDFIFKGWFNDGVQAKAGDKVLNDTVYSALFKQLFDIKFGENEPIQIADGDKLVLPEVTPQAPQGYVFDGWYNGNEKVSANTTVTSDLTLTAKFKFNNPTSVQGDGYYTAGALVDIKGGWPTVIIPYSTDRILQFFCYAPQGEWGGIDVTKITIYLDVSQSPGEHKVYTLVGCLDSFGLYNEKGEQIAYKLNDVQTSNKNTDDPNAIDIYRNYSGPLHYNIEVRVPYVALVGADYDFSKGMPVIGVAAQSYYANYEGKDFTNNSAYSTPFNNPEDPETYTRIKYQYSETPSDQNLLRWTGKVNVGKATGKVTLVNGTETKDVNLSLNEAYDFGTPTKDHYIFKGWNTKEDGKGTTYASQGTYEGNFKEDITLYAIFEAEKYMVKFGEDEAVEYAYGQEIVIPKGQDFEDEDYSYKFNGWKDGNGNMIQEGATAEKDIIYEADYTVTSKHQSSSSSEASSSIAPSSEVSSSTISSSETSSEAPVSSSDSSAVSSTEAPVVSSSEAPVVSSSETPVEPAPTKGCGGSIVAASAIVSAFALVGFIALSAKRKHE